MNSQQRLIGQSGDGEGVKPTLMQSFKTSTMLNKALAKERKREDMAAFVTSDGGKALLTQHREEKMDRRPQFKVDNTAFEAEVRALENHVKLENNPRTEEMIRKQRDSRRQRHIQTLNEFERITDELESNVQVHYQTIKQDITVFLKQSEAGK